MKLNLDKIQNSEDLNIETVEIYNDNNYSLKFYTYGGYIHEIKIPYLNEEDKREDVLLGYGDIQGVLQSNGYFNSIVGRNANRISNSEFKLNGKTFNLFANNSNNNLHGGKEGFNKKIWKIKNIEESSHSIKCTLNYFSKNMEEGFPGNLETNITYELNNQNEINITVDSISDEDTIVNITNHNYWNLHGHKDHYQNNIDHIVKINSKFICETDDQSIPTGKILQVKGTKYDLNSEFRINNEFLDGGGIDHNYVLHNQIFEESVAKIYSLKTRMGVEYYTNQKGIQFYTGNMILDKYLGKYNKSYGIQYGMCLEPQHYPDAINNSNFPTPILRKNKNYLSKIKIKLRNDF